MRKTVTGIALALLLTNMLIFAASIQQANSSKLDGNAPVLKSVERHFVLSFSTPQVVRIGHYDWLKMENCSYLTKPCQPMLPVRTLVVKLSEKSMITEVRVDVKEALLPGTFSILPTPLPTIVGSPSLEKISEDPLVYESQDLFPSGWYVYREAHGIDAETNTRVKYLIVNLFPLRFLPAGDKVLRAENISIAVDYVETEISTSVTTVKNLIITSPTLEGYAIELAQWKNNTGISSKVVNTTWIYAYYSGVDNQEKIRNCIKDFVATYGVIYVTIFGDADQVPVRYVYVPDGVDTYTPTDLYYADLDGTWDDNGDGLYADQRYDNVDGIPDVYIGRIPPSLVEYAQTAIDKIKGYQQQFNTSQNWTRRIVLAAGTGHNGVENTLGNATTVLKEYIACVATDKDIVKLYESAGNLSTASMASQINDGCLFLNFAGHGDPGTGLGAVGWLFYWVIPGLIWNGFGISDVQSRTNGFKLPVVTTMACSTARFDDADCIGEWFVLEPDGGSIAYFGSTRVTWGYANEFAPYGLMGEIDRRIYESYYEDFTKLGQTWGESISSYIENHPLDIMFYDNGDPIGYLNEKTVMEFVLLGDPTLRIYNGPETLKVPKEYATIQGAINAAFPGDIIYVHSGTYYENVVVNKTVSLIGENKDETVIDGSGRGHVIQILANNVSIFGFTIQKSGKLYPSNCGIHVSSSGNNVSYNIILNNDYGIRLKDSSNNSIYGNNITNNSYDGVYLHHSSNNIISENKITANQGSGIRLFSYSSNNTIWRNNITRNDCGIELYWYSFNNTISGNNLETNDWFGINLYDHANNNSIYENKITSNKYGIFLNLGSSDNRIYHNNFVNNTRQVNSSNSVNIWDDGYPSGGNYWSDYTDVDLFSGPYQNITGSDGIGDTPYVIDVDNQDRYPLIKPWRPADMPYVFVYPENIVAKAGQNITVTVAVSNLTDNVYTTNGEWHIGEPLPPYDPLGIHRYPMGYLVGFDVTFSWDPNILEYKNRTVTVPYETYPNPIPPLDFTGTLHQPIQPIRDNVNATLGTYQLAKAHVGSNYFNGNGTLFKMTFRIKKTGCSPLNIVTCKLAAPPNSQVIGKTYDSPGIIPHGVRSASVSVSYEPDVAVVSVKPSKTVVGLGYDLIMNIPVTNEGHYTETFNVTLYANTTAIVTQPVTLAGENSTTITFTWNTTGFAKGNYTIRAYAWPLRNETDISDNNCTGGWIIVTIPGDVDGNFEVDIYDVTAICVCYDSKIGPPRDPMYYPNCDLDGNGVIDIFDVTAACITYGQKYP